MANPLWLTGCCRSRIPSLIAKWSSRYWTQWTWNAKKGVTIKASAVRMYYDYQGKRYELNLIDTPGHVDFNYEVSRALEACEGAVLVVDATQGVEAQTLANLYLAIESNLTILPVINKIDLASARPDEAAEEIEALIGTPAESVLRVSAKEGINVDQLLDAIVEQIPAPQGNSDAPLQALIFDSHYDSYKGVVAYIRVVNGSINMESNLRLMATNSDLKPVEVGIFSPGMVATGSLQAGDVGYIATGFKSVKECRVGDTLTLANNPAAKPLPGYRHPKPMVFAGIYPVEGEDYEELKEALEKLQLNDASLTFDPETSQALNFGFRCGFLGLFHMEIIQERIEREYDLDIVVTAPSVEYEVVMNDGEIQLISSPAKLPDETLIAEVREPWMRLEVITPTEFYGVIMDLVTSRRGTFISQDYPAPNRVQLNYDIPLSELIVDFFDELKSRTRGYASMDYHFLEYRPGNLVKLEILVDEEPVDALAAIVHKRGCLP